MLTIINCYFGIYRDFIIVISIVSVKMFINFYRHLFQHALKVMTLVLGYIFAKSFTAIYSFSYILIVFTKKELIFFKKTTTINYHIDLFFN